jgi:hypothetical protein
MDPHEISNVLTLSIWTATFQVTVVAGHPILRLAFHRPSRWIALAVIGGYFLCRRGADA